jgi:hypothetical protein
MRCHRNSSWILGSVVLALAVPAAVVPAAAQESGKWFGRAVLVTLSSKSVKLEHRANHTVSITEYDGAVFNADGKPFLDKARYQVVDLTDAGTSSGGYKTFTETDGSKGLCQVPPERREAAGVPRDIPVHWRHGKVCGDHRQRRVPRRPDQRHGLVG